jgi:hypothetical protein
VEKKTKIVEKIIVGKKIKIVEKQNQNSGNQNSGKIAFRLSCVYAPAADTLFQPVSRTNGSG